MNEDPDQRLEKYHKRIVQLENCLSNADIELKYARSEVRRKSDTICKLSQESEAKDKLLHQLDLLIGRLIFGWQCKEKELNLRLVALKSEKDQSIKDLNDLKERWKAEVEQLQGRMRKSVEDMEAKMEEQTAGVEQAKQRESKVVDELKKTQELLNTKQKELDDMKRTLNEEREQNATAQADWHRQLNEFQTILKNETRLQRNQFRNLLVKLEETAKLNEKEKIELQLKLACEYEHRLYQTMSEKEKEMQQALLLAETEKNKALQEASEHYHNELNHLRKNAQTELTRQLSEVETRIEVERRRVELAEKQANRWRLAAREAEKARSNLASRLNEFVQSRCSEAMQMLHAQTPCTMQEVLTETETKQVAVNEHETEIESHLAENRRQSVLVTASYGLQPEVAKQSKFTASEPNSVSTNEESNTFSTSSVMTAIRTDLINLNATTSRQDDDLDINRTKHSVESLFKLNGDWQLNCQPATTNENAV